MLKTLNHRERMKTLNHRDPSLTYQFLAADLAAPGTKLPIRRSFLLSRMLSLRAFCPTN